MSKISYLKTATPHLWVEYTLYPMSKGGKTKSISLGDSCPCFVEKNPLSGGFDAYPLLADKIMSPSETRYLGLWFMNPKEAKPVFEKARNFYLWEGSFIGEAIVKLDYTGLTGNERLYEAGLLQEYDHAQLVNDESKIAEIWKRILPP